MKPFRNLLLAGVLALAATSCIEETTPDQPVLTAEVQDYGTLDIETAAAIDVAEGTANADAANQANATASLGGCATRTRVTTANTTTLTLAFNNTICADGRTRNGSITISWAANAADTLVATKTVSTNGYTVNGNLIDVDAVVTYNGGTLTKTIVASASVVYSDNTTASWTTNRTWQWSAGSSTPFVYGDDEFTLTGTAALVSRNNVATAITITPGSPLVWRRRCTLVGQFVSGIITIAPTGQTPAVINYGSGACDNIATLTIGDRTGTIQLR